MLTLFFALKRKVDQNAVGVFFHVFLPKSICPFQNWTKKMSKNEKGIYFSEKS
jgi:hypothetical protein